MGLFSGGRWGECKVNSDCASRGVHQCNGGGGAPLGQVLRFTSIRQDLYRQSLGLVDTVKMQPSLLALGGPCGGTPKLVN